MGKKWMSYVVSFLCLFACSGCGGQTVAQEDRTSEDNKLQLVATTTMLYDLATILGGDVLTCEGLMQTGVDPHLYKASAGDVAKLQQADIILYHGLHLEGEMGTVFQSMEAQGKTVLSVEQALQQVLLREEDGVVDPHIWFDVTLWSEVVEYVARCLIEIDPEHQTVYLENKVQYQEALMQLHNEILEQVAQIPETQRVLVTAHDAFGYFGAAYGFEVMGLQGLSTQAEISTSQIATLANLIAEREINAIFVETSVPEKYMEALQAAVKAQGFEVRLGGALYSDSLGEPSLGHDTYITTQQANIKTIVGGLLG